MGLNPVKQKAPSVKNLLKLSAEPERTSSRFRVQKINSFYYAWGADAADINNDGREDIVVANGFITQPDDTGDL